MIESISEYIEIVINLVATNVDTNNSKTFSG